MNSSANPDSPTAPLREEHKELLPHIETMLRVADSVGRVSADKLLEDVDGVRGFLSNHLIPHAYAEEEALYPVVGRELGNVEAAATMSRDHVEIGKLTEQLASLREELDDRALNAYLENELRRLLYGLYALVKVHFAKEEEIYLPLLDARLSVEEMRQVYEAMEGAAHRAMQRAQTRTSTATASA